MFSSPIEPHIISQTYINERTYNTKHIFDKEKAIKHVEMLRKVKLAKLDILPDLVF